MRKKGRKLSQLSYKKYFLSLAITSLVIAVVIVIGIFLAPESTDRVSLLGVPKISVNVDDVVRANKRSDGPMYYHEYLLNLVTKEVTSTDYDKLAAIKELGINEDDYYNQNTRVYRRLIEVTPASDKRQFLIVVGTYDRQLSPVYKDSDFFMPVSTKELICDIATSACESSTILTEATARVHKEGVLLESESLDTTDFWHAWNPDTGMLIGYAAGGGCPCLPIVTYNSRTKTFQRTKTTEFRESVGDLVANKPLDKIAILETPEYSEDQQAWIYNTTDLSTPHAIIENIAPYNERVNLSWSTEGHQLFLNSYLTLSIIDINNKSVRQLISVRNLVPQIEKMAGEYPNLHLSPSGRYLYFSKYENDEGSAVVTDNNDGARFGYPVAIDLHSGQFIKYDDSLNFVN